MSEVEVENAPLLCPLNKPPHHSAATTLLLLGADGVGKHDLARSMVDLNLPFTLQVRTATSLPLPSDDNGGRPRIDFVVFVIDATNRKSFRIVQTALPLLDASYFLGRCCFVVTGTDKHTSASMEVEVITQLAKTYDSPLFFGNMNDADNKTGLAGRILEIARFSASLNSNFTPLLLNLTSRRATHLN